MAVSFHALALALALSLPARPAQATIVPSPRWFGGSVERWETERPHPFVGGGYAIVISQSVDAWWLDGWNVTGGVELPVGTWMLVPRVHLSGVSDSHAGDVLWGRIALDGRLSSRRGGAISYYEAGVGFGVIDFPVPVFDADFNERRERRSAGTPLLQIVTGLKGDPDVAVAFFTEVTVVLALGAERPGALELAVGLEF